MAHPRMKIKVEPVYMMGYPIKDWVNLIVGDSQAIVRVHKDNLLEIMLRFRIYETEPRKRKLEN